VAGDAPPPTAAPPALSNEQLKAIRRVALEKARQLRFEPGRAPFSPRSSPGPVRHPPSFQGPRPNRRFHLERLLPPTSQAPEPSWRPQGCFTYRRYHGKS
jgi:hypothetical protein